MPTVSLVDVASLVGVFERFGETANYADLNRLLAATLSEIERSKAFRSKLLRDRSLWMYRAIQSTVEIYPIFFKMITLFDQYRCPASCSRSSNFASFERCGGDTFTTILLAKGRCTHA